MLKRIMLDNMELLRRRVQSGTFLTRRLCMGNFSIGSEKSRYEGPRSEDYAAEAVSRNTLDRISLYRAVRYWSRYRIEHLYI